MLWTTKRKRIIVLTFGVAFPLVLGAVLYVWIKPNAWCAHIICQVFHIPTQTAFDEYSVPIFGSFIKHQLCDVLFAFSLTFAMLLLMGNSRHGVAAGCAAALIFETLLEVAQLGVFPGNFDSYDIIAESIVTIAIFIAIKILQTKRRTKAK